jgi:hypothetical protein
MTATLAISQQIWLNAKSIPETRLLVPNSSVHYTLVMAGLVPAIHVLR